MTKSVHIIGSRNSGGAERFYARLVTALHEAQETVTALCQPDAAFLGDIAGPRISPLRMRSVWDYPARWKIRGIARACDADIVQTYMGRATRLTHFKPGRRPVHIARLGGYYNLKGYRHAHAWVGNTQGICDYLVNNGLPARQVFHISNFVEPSRRLAPDQLNQFRNHWRIPPDAWCVCAVGRLHENKGIGDLLQAFARLPREIQGRPLRLLIAGDGPLRDVLREMGRALNIDERIIWAGWQQETAPFYECADLFVCPSRHEPLGNVILEAWNQGVPVLSTRTQGALELMKDGENGRLVPIEAPQSLADSILELLSGSPENRRQLALQGAATLERNHSKATVVGAYRELYAQLLEQL